MFSLRAWQSISTTSLQVLFGLPLSLGPSTSCYVHFFTQSSSSFRSTCPYRRSLFCCSTNVLLSIRNLSLSSLVGNLSFSLTPHIHLTILITVLQRQGDNTHSTPRDQIWMYKLVCLVKTVNNNKTENLKQHWVVANTGRTSGHHKFWIIEPHTHTHRGSVGNETWSHRYRRAARWPLENNLDGRRFCVPKFRSSTLQQTTRQWRHWWFPTTFSFCVTNHSEAALLWFVRQDWANINSGSPPSCGVSFWQWPVASPSEMFSWQVRYLLSKYPHMTDRQTPSHSYTTALMHTRLKLKLQCVSIRAVGLE